MLVRLLARLCLICFALMFADAGAQAAPRATHTVPIGVSVKSLLDYARTRNPEYAAMQFEVDAAAARAEGAGRLPDPRLRVEWMEITQAGEQNPTLLPSRTGSTVYTLMQELPWFGKRALQRDIADLDIQGAKGRAAWAWADIAARIKVGFAQWVSVHENTRLNQEILDLLTRLEKVAQVRYAAGLAVQADAIRAQVDLTMVKNELIALENEQRMTAARLNMLLARPADAALAAPSPLHSPPPAARLDAAVLLARARATNPQLASDEARRQAAEKNRDLIRRNRYPDFSIGVAPTQMRNSIRDWALMLEVSIPFQQSTRRANEREAQAMVAAAAARLEATANQLQAELAENISGLDAARRTGEIIRANLLPQTELTFKSALASYENGKVDFATLLDAQRQIRIARQSLIKSEAETQNRLAAIERILGEET